MSNVGCFWVEKLVVEWIVIVCPYCDSRGIGLFIFKYLGYA